MNELILGIDGGGTRTRALLANMRGDILGRGEGGAANPHANGLEAARREILTAIERAFASAHLNSQRASAACLGIGGVERLDERAEFSEWVRGTISERAVIANDGEILVAAGTPDNCGIAVVAGTGSIAWGKSREGQIARAGGWGYLIGDEGSAFGLASDALRAAAHAADGRGEPTRLLRDILTFWNLAEPTELIPRVYRSGLRHTDIARLAPLVIHAAEEGDRVAENLVTRAGEELARAALAVAHALKFKQEEISLALTGGLLLETELVRVELLRVLARSEYRFAPIELVREPAIGAVRLARELVREQI